MAHARSPVPPTSMTVVGDVGGFIPHSNSRPSSGVRKKLNREGSSSSLEILPPEVDTKGQKPRRGSGHKKSTHSITKSSKSASIDHREECSQDPDSFETSRPPSSQRRTPTPSKQISLQTVRRKDKHEDGAWAWSEQKSICETNHQARCGSPDGSRALCEGMERLEVECNTTNNSSEPDGSQPGPSHSDDTRLPAVLNSTDNSGDRVKPDLVDLEDSDAFDTDLEDGESSGDEEEQEQRPKAPNELLMEFLTCVMQGDYENAQKLCKMVLIYEPENEDALNFQGLIEEKMRLDEEETDSDDDSDDDDSDDDDEDYEDDSDEESDSDDDDDDNDDEETDSDQNDEDRESEAMLKKDNSRNSHKDCVV